MVVAFIPTMPSRMNVLPIAVTTLLPQVDRLHIFCFGCDLRRFPKYDNLWLYPAFNRGSASRFAVTELYRDDYLAFCDDDLEYPPDYIDRLKAGIERYKRKAVVGWHGRIFAEQPIISYFGMGPGRNKKHCAFNGSVQEDTEVHYIGTGAMMYHSSLIQLGIQDFKYDNLDDVEASIIFQQHEIPMIVLAHRPGEVVSIPTTGDTIYNQTVRDQGPLLDLINSHKWKLFGKTP